jgi:hypothetical protein
MSGAQSQSHGSSLPLGFCSQKLEPLCTSTLPFGTTWGSARSCSML